MTAKILELVHYPPSLAKKNLQLAWDYALRDEPGDVPQALQVITSVVQSSNDEQAINASIISLQKLVNLQHFSSVEPEALQKIGLSLLERWVVLRSVKGIEDVNHLGRFGYLLYSLSANPSFAVDPTRRRWQEKIGSKQLKKLYGELIDQENYWSITWPQLCWFLQTEKSEATQAAFDFAEETLGADHWKNISTVFSLYEGAEVEESASAQYALGNTYLFEENGVVQNIDEAIFWLRKAADQGDVHAQINLGATYAKHNGNYSQAASWYRKAMEQECVEAMYSLGQLYFQGRGVKEDKPLAFNLFIIAAHKGFVRAQEDIGVMYAKGLGVQRSAKRARHWLEKAVEQGSAVAKNNLETIIDGGSNMKLDRNPFFYTVET